MTIVIYRSDIGSNFLHFSGMFVTMLSKTQIRFKFQVHPALTRDFLGASFNLFLGHKCIFYF